MIEELKKKEVGNGSKGNRARIEKKGKGRRKSEIERKSKDMTERKGIRGVSEV